MNVRPLLWVLASLVGFNAVAAEDSGVVHHTSVDSIAPRLIVKWRAGSSSLKAAQSADTTGRKTIQSAGMTVRSLRMISPRMEVLRVENAANDAQVNAALDALRANPDVEYAAPDRRRFPHALPNDPLYSGQWYLQNAQPSAINAAAAWDKTTGSSGTVIAFLDTGVRFDHPDLQRAVDGGRLLPGYDFVSADPGSSPATYLSANDGDGWDADPTDPGDWIDANDKKKSIFSTCDIEESSWHGTRVAGILGAKTNNGVGVAGITWSSWLLPVRVLGKCGGYDSDIIAGMHWAAGVHVAGVPDNPYPAKIINLSLGASGSCTAPYQQVISDLTAIGVVVVVSAGNDGGSVDEPADCTGVVGVAGVRQAGNKVGYSNMGPEVAISAPAGNCPDDPNCSFSIDTTYDLGTTVPSSSSYTDHTVAHDNIGTSFSAPIAAGTLALMNAVNGKLNTAQLISRLKQSATAFPTPDITLPTCPTVNAGGQCNCTTITCGAGMVNALAAVNAALRPIVGITTSPSIAAGQNLTLNGSTSSAACGRTIASYAWTFVSSNPSGAAPTIQGADQANAIVLAPSSGSLTFRLTVTDDQGSIDSADVVVTPSSATATAGAVSSAAVCPVAIPAPTPAVVVAAPASHGGGGGALTSWMLLALATLGLTRKHYTRSASRV